MDSSKKTTISGVEDSTTNSRGVAAGRKREKYIGFLEEESNEESSEGEDDDMDEEDRITKFLSKIS